MAYIYKITNDINQKVYIGKTEFSIEKRFKEHCQDAFRNRNEQRPLYSAMRKYGVEHFQIELIEETKIPEEREQYWIKFYNSYHNGYNATLGGDGKKYINYDTILALYDEGVLTQKEIADECNCSIDSVRHIVYQNRNNVNWALPKVRDTLRQQPKAVKCIEYNKIFHSIVAAARWVEQEGLTNSFQSARNHIGEVCNGKRKTCCKLHWQFIEL